jgi:hypothetical protein
VCRGDTVLKLRGSGGRAEEERMEEGIMWAPGLDWAGLLGGGVHGGEGEEGEHGEGKRG